MDGSPSARSAACRFGEESGTLYSLNRKAGRGTCTRHLPSPRSWSDLLRVFNSSAQAMHPGSPNSGLVQVTNELQELARCARQEKWDLAFQVITAINGLALTGVAATHRPREIRRAERESGRLGPVAAAGAGHGCGLDGPRPVPGRVAHMTWRSTVEGHHLDIRCCGSGSIRGSAPPSTTARSSVRHTVLGDRPTKPGEPTASGRRRRRSATALPNTAAQPSLPGAGPVAHRRAAARRAYSSRPRRTPRRRTGWRGRTVVASTGIAFPTPTGPRPCRAPLAGMLNLRPFFACCSRTHLGPTRTVGADQRQNG